MRKIFISLAAILAVGAGGAYLYPSTAILTAIKVRASLSTTQIGPPRDIAWQQGPAISASVPSERPPNIVVIMADDLGYNDISTFGGGVAGGRLQTPNIDALAAQGAVFTQSYSGASTCAPSRAMPTRLDIASAVVSCFSSLGPALLARRSKLLVVEPFPPR